MIRARLIWFKLIIQRRESVKYRKNNRLQEAARCFEEAADREDDRQRRAELLQRAAGAYGDGRHMADAGRCCRQACELLEHEEKAQCLMAYWRSLILEIAGCQYECSYEWRGATDGSHDDDHDFYQGLIKRYRGKPNKSWPTY